MNRAIVLTNGFLKLSDAKTAHGLIRGTERFKIIGVVDGAETAGKDAGEILDGKHRNIPVFESLFSAKQNLTDINFLIVGIATVGGRLPESMLTVIIEAIESGISIVNGLHDYLNDKPEVVKLAEKNKVQLIDIRKPKARKDLSFWSGEVFKVNAPIIAVMEPRVLTPEAQRALAEAAERRQLAEQAQAAAPKELGGQSGPDPVRYGDWEKSGIVSDF